MTFKEVRNEYERQREEQRKALSDYLKVHEGLSAAGLHVVTAGTAGKGCEHYNSQGRIAEFDLRNWKWVQVKGKDGFDCVISLNMLEMDKNTKDIHSLYDRIGFVFSPDPAGWVCTDIDLPLDDHKMEKIAQLVLEQYKLYQEKHKEN